MFKFRCKGKQIISDYAQLLVFFSLFRITTLRMAYRLQSVDGNRDRNQDE